MPPAWVTRADVALIGRGASGVVWDGRLQVSGSRRLRGELRNGPAAGPGPRGSGHSSAGRPAPQLRAPPPSPARPRWSPAAVLGPATQTPGQSAGRVVPPRGASEAGELVSPTCTALCPSGLGTEPGTLEATCPSPVLARALNKLSVPLSPLPRSRPTNDPAIGLGR